MKSEIFAVSLTRGTEWAATGAGHRKVNRFSWRRHSCLPRRHSCRRPAIDHAEHGPDELLIGQPFQRGSGYGASPRKYPARSRKSSIRARARTRRDVRPLAPRSPPASGSAAPRRRAARFGQPSSVLYLAGAICSRSGAPSRADAPLPCWPPDRRDAGLSRQQGRRAAHQVGQRQHVDHDGTDCEDDLRTIGAEAPAHRLPAGPAAACRSSGRASATPARSRSRSRSRRYRRSRRR